MLNFSLFFLAVSITAFGTLYTAPPTKDRTYYVCARELSIGHATEKSNADPYPVPPLL